MLSEVPDGSEVEGIIMATGGEVQLALAAQGLLAGRGHAVRVVNMASWELFDDQPEAYRHEVLPPTVTARVAVEEASTMGWERYTGSAGRVIGFNTFGLSAPIADLQQHVGFTAEHVADEMSACSRVRQLGEPGAGGQSPVAARPLPVAPAPLRSW